MKNIRIVIAIAVLTLASTARARADEPQPARPVVTVAPFDTGRTSWVPPPDFGATLAELLGQRLVATGFYRVMDAEYLLGNPSAAELRRPEALGALEQRAKDAGVKYLVVGTLTSYSKEQRKKSGGAAAIVLSTLLSARLHVPLPIAGGMQSTATDSRIELAVSVIDVQTGELVTSATGEGLASRHQTSLGGFGAAFGAPSIGGFSSSTSGSNEAMLNEAMVDALDQLQQAMTNAAARLR